GMIRLSSSRYRRSPRTRESAKQPMPVKSQIPNRLFLGVALSCAAAIRRRLAPPLECGALTAANQGLFRVTPKLGESGMSQVSWKGVWLVDFPRRRAANLNQGWDGSPGRSRRVDRLAEAADCGA